MSAGQVVAGSFVADLVEYSSADSTRIPERLGHLLTLNAHQPVVDPVVGEAVAGCSGLRELIFMVREPLRSKPPP